VGEYPQTRRCGEEEPLQGAAWCFSALVEGVAVVEGIDDIEEVGDWVG
jgi:hypothetical protein